MAAAAAALRCVFTSAEPPSLGAAPISARLPNPSMPRRVAVAERGGRAGGPDLDAATAWVGAVAGRG